MNETEPSTDGVYKTRPVVQDASIEGHVEVILAGSNETIILDDEIARCLAEDMLRVVHGHTSENDGDEEA